MAGRDELLGLLTAGDRAQRVLHVEDVPARAGRQAAWPGWADPDVVAALRRSGVDRPWEHQSQAADAAWSGRSVVLATGTGSGKSLAYLLPALTAVRRGAREPSGRGATALYVSPTKALAADQLATVAALGVDGVRAATYDGDTPADERRWVREHASYVLTNPDLLHHSLLPGHQRWAGFLRGLRFVVLDECHAYRGVFGSHVAAVLRRLQRVCAHYGSDPTVVLTSATTADPGATAEQLLGRAVDVVTRDSSPRGAASFLLWEPPLRPGGGEHGAPSRRSTAAETADVLADLVCAGVRTLAFTRSRRGAETVSDLARRLLDAVDPALGDHVAAYRGGYLPEERRELEGRLRAGALTGLATTSALELGIDVQGLDVVLLAGWPGTRASLWQRAGRAGRAGADSVTVLVAGDDPLDTYLVHHPEAIFGRDVEATVLDPHNPYVLGPHLCAAAAELPLTERDLPLFGPGTTALLELLVARGALRRRPTGWFWTRPERASDLADLRGTGGDPVRVVENRTGRVLGTVDAGSADHAVHEGAVYVHQGAAFVVESLDLAGGVALVRADEPSYTTQARVVTDVSVLGTDRRVDWGRAVLRFGSVEVTQQVVAYLRRDRSTGRVLDEHPLHLPPRTLRTKATWWTVPTDVLAERGLQAPDVPGAAHAAEHAAIGMLPLVATCDRWDVGGMSTAQHPHTGAPTVFVHDGHPGGAGFAERGFAAASRWLQATRDAILACECDAGCPSCVQSPKCGNGNEPLDKAGALEFLGAMLDGVPGPGHVTRTDTPNRDDPTARPGAVRG